MFTGGNKKKKKEKLKNVHRRFQATINVARGEQKALRAKNPSLVVLSLRMQSAFWVSHCVKKKHIQMYMTIKC